jgi:hypothetical protein
VLAELVHRLKREVALRDFLHRLINAGVAQFAAQNAEVNRQFQRQILFAVFNFEC